MKAEAETKLRNKYSILEVERGGAADREQLSKRLRTELEHHGFALLSFPEELHRLLEAHQVLRKEFFDRPEAWKQRCACGQTEQTDMGYCLRPRLKEQYQIRLGAAMKWPSSKKAKEKKKKKERKEAGELKETCWRVFVEMEELARRLFGLVMGEAERWTCDSVLDPPLEILHLLEDSSGCSSSASSEERVGEGYLTSSVLTLTRYFNDPDGLEESCHTHGDAGILTLCLLPEPGLNLFDPCGAFWFKSEYIPLLEQAQNKRVSAIMLSGETLHRLSKGRILASAHSVTKENNTNGERHSTVFKLRARPDVVGPRTDADYFLFGAQQKAVERWKQRMDDMWHHSGAGSMSAEVLLLIFSFLENPKDLCSCSLVCKQWHQPTCDDALWQPLFLARWPKMEAKKQAKRWKQKYKKQHLIDAKKTEMMGDVENLWKQLLDHRKSRSSAQSQVNAKVMLVGDIGVGKTCLAITIADGGAFPEDYIPSVFDEWTGSMELSAGLTVHFSLWDTMGDDLSSSASSPSSYSRLRALGYPGTDVYLLCFAIDDPESLRRAEEIYLPEVRGVTPDVPVLLVGLKADVRETSEKDVSRMVALKEAREVAKRVNAGGWYYECSAKRNEGVTETIMLALRLALLKQFARESYLASPSTSSSANNNNNNNNKCNLQ
ncbi:GTP-binding protein rhoA [Balamuthia mandrillaris]